MTELNEVLRRLPIGEKFAIDIRPDGKSADFPNVVGTIVRHRHGFVFSEATETAAEKTESAAAPKKAVAKRKASVRK